jgi:hypothetical protein
MVCIRCGEPAIVKRDDGFYCGKCALTRDWQEIVGVIQDARVDTPVAGDDEHDDEGVGADPFAARTA